MRIFLKILNYFFVTLGVLFFMIILVGIYLFVADPFGLKPLLGNLGISPSTAVDIISGKTTKPATTTSGSTDKNPSLTAEQEKQLESLGIDPATVPTTITPQMGACLVQKLGKARADELLKGSAPTPMDFLKAGSCLKQ